MFGREYYKYPELLTHSFSEMSKDYGKKKIKKSSLMLALQKTYVFLFGVPEIGFQIRYLYFNKILKTINTKIVNVLDLGTGIGSYAFNMARRFKGSNIEGWDISDVKINCANKLCREKNCKNVNFYKKNFLSINKIDTKFDLIVMIDVLEHIKESDLALRRISALLNKGGYFYIHVPRGNQKRIFKQLENWEHEGHLHEGFSSEDLKNKLKKLNFKIIKHGQTFGFFGKLSWELNHLMLARSLILASLIYPFLYLLCRFDLKVKNTDGLAMYLLAKKEK
jgi:2-polyprenyl-3-methyl-5-hydroxy-6-metoxy-1,4-benzoquinol methylase